MKSLPKNQWRFARVAALTALGMLMLEVHPPTSTNGNTAQVGQSAIARSSGGRAKGGSFQRSAPPSNSNSQGRSFQNSQPSVPRQNYGGPIFVPPPVIYPQPNFNQPYASQSQGNAQGNENLGSTPANSGFSSILPNLLVLLILGGVAIATIVWLLPKLTRRAVPAPDQEIANNVFTVTKLQVALYVQAREIQSNLSQLSLEVNTDEPAGLLRLLQESALALLRQPEYWTHVNACSQTASNALDAERLLNQLSIEARSKLSVETLVNVGGRSQHSVLKTPDVEEDPAAYIVVTLLIGTAHDQPLFDKIQTTTALQEILEKLAALPSEYLMALELIWSPQDASDSLTEEELLTEYSDLMQI